METEQTYSNGRRQYRDDDEEGTAEYQYQQAYKKLEQDLMRRGYVQTNRFASKPLPDKWTFLWADGFEAFEGTYYGHKTPSVRLSEHGKTSIMDALKASKISEWVGDACDAKWGEANLTDWKRDTRLYHTIPVTNPGLLGLAGKVTLSVTTFYGGFIDVSLTVEIMGAYSPSRKDVSPDDTLMSFWVDEDGMSVRDDVDRNHQDVRHEEYLEYQIQRDKDEE